MAVVGAGVSGLTAARLLQRSFDVTLYEADARLGGHAHTHEVVGASGDVVSVDSGFIVYNERTYPNLVRLFHELGVETRASEMSMSVRCRGCGLEYAGARGFGGVFAQPRRAASPAFLRMLAEVKRFHRSARALLAAAAYEPAASSSDVTLQDFLTTGRFSSYFVRHFMVPVVSCVWSCPPPTALQFPAAYLFHFLDHHGFLSIGDSPQWRTVVGGSRSYVERAAKELTATSVGVPVRAVTQHASGVDVRDELDEVAHFDGAVIATHADQALKLLDRPSDAQRAVLGAFGYAANHTVLHTDASLLPAAPRARSSWNYLLDRCDGGAEGVKVSYHMNRLQGIEGAVDYLVTLNADDRIRADAVVARMDYTHPVYTPGAVAAQARLPELDTDRLAFAGAYHGWGFHEDGCVSGVRAAAHFGVTW
jgi:predicted NAD/FAD-binding protein